MKQKSIDDAIKKSAVMLYPNDWASIKGFDQGEITQALIMVCQDCWSQELQDKLGNGFIGMPNDRSNEVAKSHPGPISAIYRILMHSVVSSRKSYIRNNSLLKKRLEEVLGDKVM